MSIAPPITSALLMSAIEVIETLRWKDKEDNADSARAIQVLKDLRAALSNQPPIEHE